MAIKELKSIKFPGLDDTYIIPSLVNGNGDILDANGTLKNDVLPEGYPYKAVGEIIPETVIPIDPDMGQGVITDEFELYIGNSYIVNYNGTEYNCEAKSLISGNMEFIGLGNVGVMDESGENEITDEPFLSINVPTAMVPSFGFYGIIIPLDGVEEVTLSIYGNITKKISKEFLPSISNINNIIDGSKPGSVRTIATSDIIGICAHAEGWSTTASGANSHTEGYSNNNAFDFITEESTEEEIIAAWNDNKFTLAYGDSSHAEGNNTLALDNYSHAEGWTTTASGDSSHAEGNSTIASGSGSHAEGYYTTASGNSSHAEGYDAVASGRESHAEGSGTTASGDNSHAEGSDTTASGDNSHAEGWSTTASGANSHTEGYSFSRASNFITEESTKKEIIAAWKDNKFTLAHGDNSHAEGRNTLALGEDSHAEGGYTTASGDNSHAEGRYTTASGDNSHAEGYYTTASGDNSHAEGYYTTASGLYSHVQGQYNILDNSDQYAHIVGNGSVSTRSNAHTLDWDGNAWFQGDVYVGSTSGNNKDEGSKKLATEEFVNNKGYLTSYTETDPTVPAWAKTATKPTYTAAEVGALAADTLSTAINTALAQAKASGEFTPVRGTDYWTEADQESIVQQVLAVMGMHIIGSVNENNDIVFSGDLGAGTYTLKFEDVEGNVQEVGTIEIVKKDDNESSCTNLFDPATATLNTRMSGSSKAPKTENGYVMTATIPITATQVTGSAGSAFIAVPKSMWANSANMFLGMGTYTTQGMCSADATIDVVVGDLVKIPLRNQWGNSFTCDNITLSLYVKGSEITASDIQDIKIYFNEYPGQASQSYTNLIPKSINADGTQYVGTNGEDGYKTNVRLNSSGVESTSNATGIEVTGFMPVTVNGTVYLKNISSTTATSYFMLYDEQFNMLTGDQMPNLKTRPGVELNGEQIVSIDVSKLAPYYGIYDSICWFRISAEEITPDSIITVNQPIDDDDNEGLGDSGSIELVWNEGVKLDKDTGVEGSGAGYAASQHIELVDGYTYTFDQHKDADGRIYGGVNICYYDASGNGLGYELLWDSVAEVKSKVLTPISGAKTFRARLYYGDTLMSGCYSVTYEKTT